MNVRRSLVFIGMFTTACLFSSSAIANTIYKWNLPNGNLSDWTAFTTSNGTNGAGLPNVVSFNATGSGANDAAHFDVGDVVFDGTQQGGGLSQMIIAPISGLYTYSEDFASQDDAGGLINGNAGTFSLLIDGTTVASLNLGPFSTSLQILRGSFSGSVNLTSGSHLIQTEITKTIYSGGANTPDEYIDRIFPSYPECRGDARAVQLRLVWHWTAGIGGNSSAQVLLTVVGANSKWDESLAVSSEAAWLLRA